MYDFRFKMPDLKKKTKNDTYVCFIYSLCLNNCQMLTRLTCRDKSWNFWCFGISLKLTAQQCSIALGYSCFNHSCPEGRFSESSTSVLFLKVAKIIFSDAHSLQTTAENQIIYVIQMRENPSSLDGRDSTSRWCLHLLIQALSVKKTCK